LKLIEEDSNKIIQSLATMKENMARKASHSNSLYKGTIEKLKMKELAILDLSKK